MSELHEPRAAFRELARCRAKELLRSSRAALKLRNLEVASRYLSMARDLTPQATGLDEILRSLEDCRQLDNSTGDPQQRDGDARSDHSSAVMSETASSDEGSGEESSCELACDGDCASSREADGQESDTDSNTSGDDEGGSGDDSPVAADELPASHNAPAHAGAPAGVNPTDNLTSIRMPEALKDRRVERQRTRAELQHQVQNLRALVEANGQ